MGRTARKCQCCNIWLSEVARVHSCLRLVSGGDTSGRSSWTSEREGGRKTAFQNKTLGRMFENIHIWNPERSHTIMPEEFTIKVTILDHMFMRDE